MGGLRRQAFALIELAAVAVVIAVVAVLLLVVAPGTRHQGWQAGSIANLHEFAAVTASYQADYVDQFWSYSWRRGVEPPTQYADLRYPPTDAMAAASAQAVDAIRRRGMPAMPAMDGWLPTIFYHYLPLTDYLDTSVP